jgi:hypothetical protein
VRPLRTTRRSFAASQDASEGQRRCARSGDRSPTPASRRARQAHRGTSSDVPCRPRFCQGTAPASRSPSNPARLKGHHDALPAGDYAYRTLVGEVLTGRPGTKANEADVVAFLTPYKQWRGIAGWHLLRTGAPRSAAPTTAPKRSALADATSSSTTPDHEAAARDSRADLDDPHQIPMPDRATYRSSSHCWDLGPPVRAEPPVGARPVPIDVPLAG